jgi:hypothetical protein
MIWDKQFYPTLQVLSLETDIKVLPQESNEWTWKGKRGKVHSGAFWSPVSTET